MLTDSEVEAISSSFELMEPYSFEVARKFYQTLFELDARLQGLFHGDMRAQGQKLMDMLSFIVVNLKDPDTLLPAVKELGARHKGYEVKASHYDTVGQALVTAMADVLGPDFSEEAKEAWVKAYTVLAEVMIEASDYSTSA